VAELSARTESAASAEKFRTGEVRSIVLFVVVADGGVKVSDLERTDGTTVPK
jgi:hypothetical protein